MTDLSFQMRRFYNGALYPILIVLLSFIGHVSELDVAFMATILLSSVPAFFLCNSIHFFAMPFLCTLFTVAIKDYKTTDHGFTERFINASTFITGGITLSLVIIGIIYFAWKKRTSYNKLPKGGLWLGLAAFCILMLPGGLFSQNYTVMNAVFAVMIATSIFGLYLLFAFYTDFNEKRVDYFMYCFMLCGLLICVQLIWAYFTTVQFDANGVVKGSVVLGWGIWTGIGGMLAFLMPATFYFAASHRHGWAAYLLGLLEYFCIVLSQSRAALLFGSLGLVLCIGYLFFKGKNRKQNRLITLILFVIGVVGIVVLWDKVSALLGNLSSFGLSDNGRYEKWMIGWNHFLDYPILGSGFYDSFVDPAFEHGFDPYLYHNNLIQMLAACGIVGLLGYLFHRIQTISLFVKRRNPQNYFLAAALISFIGFNCLDVLFFKFYPGFFYAIMLLCSEHSKNSERDELENKRIQ